MSTERWIEGISKENYVNFQKIFNQYRDYCREKQIVIFGAGIMGLQFAAVLDELGITNTTFCDNDEKKWKERQKIAGKKVICPEKLRGREDAIFVFLAMERYESCAEQLEQLGYKRNISWVQLRNCSEEKIVRDFKEDNKSTVLILGDCAATVISITDNDKRSIAEMLYRTEHIKILALNSLYMRGYYNLFLMSISRMENIKKLVILLDMSIFQEKYCLFPQNQHRKVMDELENISKSQEEEIFLFEQEMRKREKSTGLLGNLSPNRMDVLSEEAVKQVQKMHMRLNYLFPMREDGESIIYLDKTLRKCSALGIEANCVILPINYQMGEEFFGNLFFEKYEAARDIIIRHIQGNNGKVLDLSYFLEKEDFISVRSTNEGLKETGRLKLVNKILQLYERQEK